MTEVKRTDTATGPTDDVVSPAEPDAAVPQADGAEAPVPAADVAVSGGVAEPALDAPAP